MDLLVRGRCRPFLRWIRGFLVCRCILWCWSLMHLMIEGLMLRGNRFRTLLALRASRLGKSEQIGWVFRGGWRHALEQANDGEQVCKGRRANVQRKENGIACTENKRMLEKKFPMRWSNLWTHYHYNL